MLTLNANGSFTYVHDGSVVYYGLNNYTAEAEEKYAAIKVADFANKELFIENLVKHQHGETDYMTFCNHCAQAGIAKWRVDIVEMTCTYFDKTGNEMLEEIIPS